MELINIFTTVFGVVATCLSITLALHFLRTKSRLSIALACMFGAEALSGLCTTIFSFGAVLAGPGGFSTEVQIILRLIIFGGAAITSLHLWRVVKRL